MKICTPIFMLILASLSACNTVTEKPSTVPIDEETVSDFKNLTDGSVNKGDQFVVSTISGGGHRAANFGLGHLLALDTIQYSENASLLDEVDVLSTVSGGGVGVSVYISAALDWINCHPNTDLKLRPGIYELLLNNPDKIKFLRKQWGSSFLLSLHPKAFLSDRTRTDLFNNRYYEKLLSKDTSNSTDCVDSFKGKQYTLKDLNKYGKMENGVPLHIPNATLSTKGLTFPYTSSMIEKFNINCIAHTSGKWAGTWKNISDPEEFPYSIGLLASAAFPPMLPDVRLGSSDGREDAVHNKLCDPNTTTYMHLTDGGQSDDNGYYTGVNVLLNEFNEMQSDGAKSALLMTVDALTSDGHYWSHEKTQNFFNVLILRNADLPRHGPKRLIGQELISKAESYPSRLNELPADSTVYAAHIKMTKPEIENSNLPTFKTAVGLSLVEQQASMAEGMLQTYISLIGDNENANNTNSCMTTGELEELIKDVTGKIVCRSYRLGTNAHGAVEKSPKNDKFCAIHELPVEPMVVLKKHVHENLAHCKSKEVTAFEKSKDDAAWTESLLATNNALTGYKNDTNQLVENFRKSIKSQVDKVFSDIRLAEEDYRTAQLTGITKLIANEYSALAKNEFQYTERNLIEANRRLDQLTLLVEQKSALYDEISTSSNNYIESVDAFLADGNELNAIECAEVGGAGGCTFKVANSTYKLKAAPQDNGEPLLVDTALFGQWLEDYKKYFHLNDAEESSWAILALEKLRELSLEIIPWVEKVSILRKMFDQADDSATGEYLLSQQSIEEGINKAKSTMSEICSASKRKRFEQGELDIGFYLPESITIKLTRLNAKSKELANRCSTSSNKSASSIATSNSGGLSVKEKLEAYKKLSESVKNMQKRIAEVHDQYQGVYEVVSGKYEEIQGIYDLYNALFLNNPVEDYKQAVARVAGVSGVTSENVTQFAMSDIPLIDHTKICEKTVRDALVVAKDRGMLLGLEFPNLCTKSQVEISNMCENVENTGASTSNIKQLESELTRFQQYLLDTGEENSTSVIREVEDIKSKGKYVKSQIKAGKLSISQEGKQLFCVFNEKLASVVKQSELRVRKYATFVRRKETLNAECFANEEVCL